VGGFFNVIEERLVVPFGTQVPGVDVPVDSVDLAEDDKIDAVCSRPWPAPAGHPDPLSAASVTAAGQRRTGSRRTASGRPRGDVTAKAEPSTGVRPPLSDPATATSHDPHR
jgi:hypothetical protein